MNLLTEKYNLRNTSFIFYENMLINKLTLYIKYTWYVTSLMINMYIYCEYMKSKI